MIRRLPLALLLVFVGLSPVILMGAVCSRAIDIPIVVTANLPNKESQGPFVLNIDEALRNAGIQPQGGRIPEGAPKSLTITHSDKFDLRSEEQIQTFGERIHSIYINDISVEAQENTLSFALPPVQVSVSELPQGSSMPANDKYTKVAEFAGVPAMELGALATPTWEQNGLKKLRETLRSFALAIQLKSTLSLKAGDPWPTGKAQFKLKFQFAFVIKPI